MNDGFRRSLVCEHAFVRIVGKACELSGAAAPAEVPQLTANFTVTSFQIVAEQRARRALVGAGVVRGLIADDVLARVARVAGAGGTAYGVRVVLAHGSAVRGRRCAVGIARAAINISSHRARAAPAGHVHAGVVAAGGAGESTARCVYVVALRVGERRCVSE